MKVLPSRVLIGLALLAVLISFGFVVFTGQSTRLEPFSPEPTQLPTSQPVLLAGDPTKALHVLQLFQSADAQAKRLTVHYTWLKNAQRESHTDSYAYLVDIVDSEYLGPKGDLEMTDDAMTSDVEIDSRNGPTFANHLWLEVADNTDEPPLNDRRTDADKTEDNKIGQAFLDGERHVLTIAYQAIFGKDRATFDKEILAFERAWVAAREAMLRRYVPGGCPPVDMSANQDVYDSNGKLFAKKANPDDWAFLDDWHKRCQLFTKMPGAPMPFYWH